MKKAMIMLNATYVKIISLMTNFMKHEFSAWHVQGSVIQSAAETTPVVTVILVTFA
jgi:hypothetical protein